MLENLPEIIKASKSAGALFKVCAKYLGWNKPEKIREEAQAQADAAKIKAQGDADVKVIEAKGEADAAIIRAQKDLVAVGLGAVVEREKEYQENRRQVFGHAVKELPPGANPENIEKIDKDKLARLFRECEIVSDSEMQLLWGKILAGEVESPGSFSKKTMSIVSNMNKKDAEMFTFFGQFVWRCEWPDNPDTIFPLMYADQWDWYTNHHLKTFEVMKHLTDMGIVSHQPDTPYIYQSEIGNKLPFFYHGRSWLVQLPDSKKPGLPFINAGNALFTQAGQQLYPICGARPNEEFLQFILARWKKHGLNPTPIPYPEK